MQKTCSQCNLSKPTSEYYKSPSYPDKLVPKCKSCVREYDQQLCERPRTLPITGLKKCCRCKQDKPITCFHARLRNSDGLRSECKACTREAEHTYRRRKPSQGYLQKLKSKYGLSEDDLLSMLAKQDGKCGICDSDDVRLVVDHSHVTQIVRGMLCHKCNAGLGMFGDSVSILANAIKYLERSNVSVGASACA